MKLNSIAVLGGGPGGLYAARLLKRSHPEASVTLYEQGAPDKTFGFGVGLASRTQRNLREADEESLNAIVEAALPHEMAMQVGDHRVQLHHGELLAIGRATLLTVLQKYARNVGVDLKFGERASVSDIDADLIVAADGISSQTRAELADRFAPTIDEGEGLYLWCGTDFALPSALFVPVATDEGTFVAHAYPYAADRSTFLIETDADTWKRAGFDRSTAETPAGESDQISLDYLEEAFADSLQGHRLIGNRTKWLQFRTVRCATWHTDKIVLLGDAAHTAHYSIGSGTKLAMEDAIALDKAILAADDLTSAFEAYEVQRRPAVEHLQAIAARSMVWWDDFPQRLDMPVEQLMVAYMTRAGKVPLARFASNSGGIVEAAAAAFSGCDVGDVPPPDGLIDWVLAGRQASDDVREAAGTVQVQVSDRPWSAATEQQLGDLKDGSVYWLVGADDRESMLDRFDVGEKLRRAGAQVVVEVRSDARDEAAAAIVSERVDLVAFADSV